MADAKRLHVALIGFMGSGKSTIGPLLARSLGIGFVDIDQAIEDRVGSTIPEIFSSEGEGTFRDYETVALREALAQSPRVISTGGGLIVRDENWSLLMKHSVPVWLHVDFSVLEQRLQSGSNRPLLRDDPGFTRARALYAQRKPLYERAPIWVDSDAPPLKVVKEIVDRLKKTRFDRSLDEVNE